MNDKPIWLDKQFVLWLHERTVERTGGSQGVRDEALLEHVIIYIIFIVTIRI